MTAAQSGAESSQVSQLPNGDLLIRLDAGLFSLVVPLDRAEHLARLIRKGVFEHAPEMRRVRGGLNPFRADVRVPVAVNINAPIMHGLECPHPGCTHIGWDDDTYDAVTIVDVDERWSPASYEREETDDGDIQETVTTGGTSGNHRGLGYRCPACERPVRLPDGIEETWS